MMLITKRSDGSRLVTRLSDKFALTARGKELTKDQLKKKAMHTAFGYGNNGAVQSCKRTHYKSHILVK